MSTCDDYSHLKLTVAELREKLADLPDDFVVTSGSDGHHIHPDDVLVFHDTREVYL